MKPHIDERRGPLVGEETVLSLAMMQRTSQQKD